ncbi:MYB4R1 [Mycena vulgaris]|nr:MYB4R1 [Mycena vulgaris]
MDLPPTPKELALRTLQANQEHQYALAQYAEKLSAELAELDKLLPQADTEDGESDLECDFYVPDAKPPIGPIRNFLHPESPFFGDATKRTRYLNFTVRHTMPAKEVEALKVAVNAEMRRVEQLGGASSTTTDSHMAHKLNWSIIAEKVSDASSITRTAEECKIKWIGELSSTINRGPWAAAEIQSLQEILKNKPNQNKVDWVEIAQELGTNRLPIDCMRHGLERPRHIWTAEADQKVLDAVRQYGMAWSLVAKYVAPDVTAGQCSSRFLRTLDPSLRRGAWSSEEDKRLIAAVAGYGKAWAEVASVVPGRTNEQCRDRWTGSLDPAKIANKKDEWAEEEDKALIEAVNTMGNRWKAIGIQMGRSANNCRLHYEKLKKQDLPASSLAGPSTPDEEGETGTPSGGSTPKPRARKNRPSVVTDPSTVAEPARPRPKPRPLAKNKSAAKGTKRAAPDSEDAPPPKKRAIQQDPVAGPVPDPLEENQGPSAQVLEGATSQTGAGPDQYTTDTSNISPAKKGKRRVAQVSNLPRRRSARLKGDEDGGER